MPSPASLHLKAAAPADLERALAGREHAVWVLAVKTDTFARIAWERGRDLALALERRVTEQFLDAARDVLRGGDMFVHAAGSDLFGFALLESSRTAARKSWALDEHRRGTLGAIERGIRDRAHVDVHAGWTLLGAGDDAARTLGQAAEHGRTLVRRREFATLLHDLTTPVSSIYGSLNALNDGVLPADVTRRFLGNALSETARVGRLIRGFLAAQNDDASACDAHHALECAMASVEPLALARDVRIERCERSVSVAAAFGEDRLTAILVSLLENAIKHGNHGGRVCARAIAGSGYAGIEIDDDGPGVPEDCLERIFGFGARASAAEGAGIGLAHARLLLETAGGEISASRSPLGGARFTLRLPAVR